MLDGLFQPTHILIIAIIALIIFGPRKLPEFGKGLGEGIRGFKDAMKGQPEEPKNTSTPTTPPSSEVKS
ncbi:MAG TPA: twin-arginine translocase TatA/TatE family subunit [Terriglobales bacterium]|jgi:sec-independent protein translocase protein TatA